MNAVKIFKFYRNKVLPIVSIMFIIIDMIILQIRPEYEQACGLVLLMCVMQYILAILIDASIDKDLKEKDNAQS